MARVLIVGNDARTFLSHRAPIADAARRAGHDVHVALPPGDALSEVRERFAVHELPLARRGLNPLAEIRTYRALVALLEQVRPDLVHLVTIKPIVYGGPAARRAGVSAIVFAVTGLGFVFTSNTALARFLRPGIERAYRRSFAMPASRVIFQNDDDLSLFVERGLITRERATVIPSSGVDVEAFPHMPQPEGPCLVALPARLLADKGVREFVEAARILRATRADVRMALVGAPDPANPAAIPQREIDGWVAEGIVEAWGWQSDMASVWRRAHIACLPSYREGVPRALLEAAACARPVVTTDVPGCRLAVEPGKTGLIVAAHDPAALADAIRSLSLDGPRRRAMGEAGRQLVLQRFTTAHVTRMTMKVYDEMLALAP